MKQLLFFAGCLLFSHAEGQVNKASDDSYNWPPAFFVDSVRVASIGFLAVSEIADVNIVKGIDYKNHANGIVQVKMKSPCTLLSINDIMKQYKLDNSGSFVFVVGNEVLRDTVNVRIDSRIVEKTTVYNRADFAYLPPGYSPMMMVCNIQLATEIPKPGTIKIQ